MKKILAIAFVGVFGLGIVGCGHGDCDAYHKADYTKYKAEKQNHIELMKIGEEGKIK